MPQTNSDHAMFFRQRSEHRRPGAEIAQRAVHAYQRWAMADLEIGHVGAVDLKRLHGLTQDGTEGPSFHGTCRLPMNDLK